MKVLNYLKYAIKKYTVFYLIFSTVLYFIFYTGTVGFGLYAGVWYVLKFVTFMVMLDALVMIVLKTELEE